MDVDAASFPLHLLGLFINISEADFVSFDLELSGIPSRLPNRKPPKGSNRCTLEERYAETKQAADRYQILQVGITCARFDYIANKYILRPYNINLSPLLDEHLDIEREISLQSGAVTFLLGCGFDMAKPFTHGVQYLSREEAARARQTTKDRLDNANQPADLQLKEGDVDSLDFMRRVREAIRDWMPTESKSLAITTHTGLTDQPSIPAISRFEKRLVHQLVRAEFPELVSVGRSECIQIVNYDALREADNNRRIMKRVEIQIARQSGFRWVIEALAGGDVQSVDPIDMVQRTNGAVFSGSIEDMRDQSERATERLRTRQPVLVGHNMFTDIVYLYRTFIGELPDTLQGFSDAIHELFPKIIDTKYLATHAEGDLNASPTLQEIAKGLSRQPLPRIATHADHSKYQNKEAFHEAGYDSLLTAKIMLQLAAKLSADREPKSPENNVSTKSLNNNTNINAQPPTPQTANPPPSKSFLRRQKKQKKKSKEASARRFHTTNIYDLLSPDADDLSSPPAAATPPWRDDVHVSDETGWVPVEQMEREAMEMIPGFDTSFWGEFGNVLRVFGTEEGVWRIRGWGEGSGGCGEEV
ncbi:ribonuclease H-like domain-containing protein [Phaeosphaeriaceae sp. PMI808]|nr:ribonuclease H-like domain-containing protein [Phaeosphaeriaceae sp. PMI808]